MRKKKGISPSVEKQIMELAISDWEAFKTLPGVNLQQIAICMERNKGKTLGEIAAKLKVPRSTVQDACKKCTE